MCPQQKKKEKEKMHIIILVVTDTAIKLKDICTFTMRGEKVHEQFGSLSSLIPSPSPTGCNAVKKKSILLNILIEKSGMA